MEVDGEDGKCYYIDIDHIMTIRNIYDYNDEN